MLVQQGGNDFPADEAAAGDDTGLQRGRCIRVCVRIRIRVNWKGVGVGGK